MQSQLLYMTMYTVNKLFHYTLGMQSWWTLNSAACPLTIAIRTMNKTLCTTSIAIILGPFKVYSFFVCPKLIPDWLAPLLLPACSPLTAWPAFNASSLNSWLNSFGPSVGPAYPFCCAYRINTKRWGIMTAQDYLASQCMDAWCHLQYTLIKYYIVYKYTHTCGMFSASYRSTVWKRSVLETP